MLCSCCNYFIIFPFPVPAELQQAGSSSSNYSILSGAAGVANCSSSSSTKRGGNRVKQEGKKGRQAMKTFALHVAHTHTHTRARTEGGNASAWKNFATAVCMYLYVCVSMCVCVLLGVACYVHECR